MLLSCLQLVPRVSGQDMVQLVPRVSWAEDRLGTLPSWGLQTRVLSLLPFLYLDAPPCLMAGVTPSVPTSPWVPSRWAEGRQSGTGSVDAAWSCDRGGILVGTTGPAVP